MLRHLLYVALLVLAAAIYMVSCSHPNADTPSAVPATVVRVVDGDTIVVDVGAAQERCRMIGIDAPESVHPDDSLNSPAGEAASAFLKQSLPAGTTVYLQADVSDRDRYGRLLRYVWLEEPVTFSDSEAESKMLNAMLVSSGHAVAVRYEPDVFYASLFERIQNRS